MAINTKSRSRVALLVLGVLLIAELAQAQGTGFTYQGRLTDAGNPADGLYEMQFKLFDTGAIGTGIQQGSAITDSAVQVTNGVFTVQLDFGPGVFDGSGRYLEIGIRPAASPNPFTVLSPRQPMSSSPYAVRSATAGSADTATNAGQLGGMSPSGFIQNTTSQQPVTSFNIGGTGTANILNAATQFNLNGLRILSNEGDSNLVAGSFAGFFNAGRFNSFFGNSAGLFNTTGESNSFFGKSAGKANTTGGSNSFFGTSAGQDNTTGSFNSFFGAGSGVFNTTGSSNSFFGVLAGHTTSSGNENSFFGRQAGAQNTIGGSNSFFGYDAGVSNTTGLNNAFFGRGAGGANSSGTGNTFIGSNANFDVSNPTGNNNTLLGANARVSSGASNATAIGAGAVVSASNTMVLGRSVDTVQVPGGLNVTGTFGANSLNATTQYNLGGFRILSNPGTDNLFAGISAGISNSTGSNNAFFGRSAGQTNSAGSDNSFFGSAAGANNNIGTNNAFFGDFAGLRNTMANSNTFIGSNAGLNNGLDDGSNHANFNTFVGSFSGMNNKTGANNTFIGANAGNPNISTQVNNSVAIGSGATVSTSNTIVIGTTAETTRISGKLVMVGGGAVQGGAIAQTFDTGTIQGIFAANLVLYDINDILASPVHLCIRSTSLGGFGGEALARCSTSSSPSQYKTNLQPFLSGLDVISRLKPMTFIWKDGGKRDFGLNAEDVAEVEPLLVTRNEKGEIEDVNEASFNVLFINAFKEHELQIKLLQQHIESLKKIVCLDHPNAPVCK
jgi:hypothetical protein